MEILKEFIFENKPTESCHASTVLPLDDGRVVAAWFAGTKESADDVDILTSVRSEGGWSEPVRVSADRNIPHWNPVLFRRADGKMMLFFKVGKKIPMWKTYFSLSDNGVDWSEPAELVPGRHRRRQRTCQEQADKAQKRQGYSARFGRKKYALGLLC